MGKKLKFITAGIFISVLIILGNSSCGKKSEEKTIAPAEEPGVFLTEEKVSSPTVIREEYQAPPSREISKVPSTEISIDDDDEDEISNYEGIPVD